MPDDTTQTNPSGVAQPAAPAPSAPAAAVGSEAPATPAVPTAAEVAQTQGAQPAAPSSHKGDVEYFKKQYQALVVETGLSINAEPKWVKRDDGSYSTILDISILPVR